MMTELKVSYTKLWLLLKERHMKKKDLQALTHLSSAVIAKLGKNQTVHMDTLLKICSLLKVGITDIVEFC